MPDPWPVPGAGAQRALWHWQHPHRDPDPYRDDVTWERVAFADLPGWAEDDHRAALAALRRSCTDSAEGASLPMALCRMALRLGEGVSRTEARAFFESHFTPCRIVADPGAGLVTGYFEPELAGSLKPGPGFAVPVYRPPDDLVLLCDSAPHPGLAPELTAARRTADGLLPYFTRGEIEDGSLAGHGLELLYLADAVDAFVMHVQGSGLVRLADGRALRLGFAAKNGHPYTSIGRLLIARGALPAEDASLDRVLAWMRADGARGRALMRENRSYAFFRVLSEGEARHGPQGALGVPLSAGRSLAVDPRYHRLGAPIWVHAPGLDGGSGRGFSRLMVAQDTGSAIRGPVRGDIYWGSGREAGAIAGGTKHGCEFYTLVPQAD